MTFHILFVYVFVKFIKLGPGLLKSTYTPVLQYELNKIGLNARTAVGLPIINELINVNIGYRLDILVEDKVIIEVKSVDRLLPVHHKQLTTYLKLAALKLGLLVNFNCYDISKNIFRIVNGI